jgi:peptidyl-prolyl cis-trans isomerase SurA
MNYKLIWLLVVLFGKVVISNGQTLFMYGKKAVHKQEFLRAFNKNPTPDAERKKALDEYLNLYINYKLKVQAGYDEKLDKQPSFEIESKNFKQQIAENLVNEEVGIKALVNEAFGRSQKDIHAAHVFIEVSQNTDTVAAFKQIQAAYNALQTGANFNAVAASYSSDAATKKANGDLGFITVFTLQYAIENEIYALQSGSFSKPFRSVFGYHIFKNIAERQAVGKRKIAQVLLALPPQPSDVEKQQIAKLADSVYNQLMHGETFENAVTKFSNDVKTVNNAGIMSEVAVGEFDANFEANIYQLKTVGEISKPFATSYGYHIIKLLEILPVNTNFNDATALDNLKASVEKDARLAIYKNAKVKQWLVQTKYQQAVYNTAALWVFTDSALYNKPLKKYQAITDSTVLFSFAKQKITASNWVQYVRQEAITSNALYPNAMANFINKSCINYYTQHLADYNIAMQQQAKEFDEANLLFAAMDKHVWGKGGEDVNGLKSYYLQHANNYQWGAGISALVVTCASQNIAVEVADKIKISPNKWAEIAASYNAPSVVVDSSRYELSQVPVKQSIVNTIGFTSIPEKNSNDTSYTFLYVTAVHPKQMPRTFDEARGMVINDYQLLLEKQWIERLKQKYPVKINALVLKTIK